MPDRGVAPGLRRLPRGLGLPLRNEGNSLQTPDDWQEHRVLRHTARELGRMGGSQQLEG